MAEHRRGTGPHRRRPEDREDNRDGGEAGLSAAWSRDGAVVVCGGQCYRHYPGNIMLGSEEDKPGGVAFAKRLEKGDRVATLAITPASAGGMTSSSGSGRRRPCGDPITLKKGVVIDQKELESLVLAPDGKLIAVGESNGMIRLHPTPEMK